MNERDLAVLTFSSRCILTFSRGQRANFFKKTTRYAKLTITLDIEELEGKTRPF